MSTFIRSNVEIDPEAVVADYGPLPNSIIDLNYETGQFWYYGERYSSISAIIAAGHGSSEGGLQMLAIPTIGSVYSLYAVGICGVQTPSYLVAIDDGVDGDPVDNIISITQNAAGLAAVLMVSNSVDQLGSNINQSGGAYQGSRLSVAARFETNDISGSFNGNVAKNDTSANLPIGLNSFIIGNRRDGLRPWGGEIHRLVLINAKLSRAELAALSGS